MRLRLRVHPTKTRVYRVRAGVTFLGWRLFPSRARLVRRNVIHARRRLQTLAQRYADGTASIAEVHQAVHAWIGHAAWGDTAGIRRQVLGSVIFVRRTGV